MCITFFDRDYQGLFHRGAVKHAHRKALNNGGARLLPVSIKMSVDHPGCHIRYDLTDSETFRFP